VCLLVLLSTCSCRRPSPAALPALVDLAILDRTPHDERPANPNLDRVRAAAVRLVSETGTFIPALGRAPRSGEEAWRLRIELRLGEGHREGRGLARAALTIRLVRVDGPVDAPRLETQGGAELPYDLGTPDADGVYTELLTRLLGDLMKGFLAQARLSHADMPTLLGAMRGEEPDLRLGAIAVVAARRERGAVPVLIERLNDRVDAVRDRALGALVEIGDPAAVRPLTEQTKFRDLEGMQKIIDAIASLGGEEARTYLEFVASGHEDAEIRQQAREALTRLRDKKERGQTRR
jgi:hypothetical protein